MGPTASGKTNLALDLADRYPISLISVDSALVYRDMNIGTAKPDAATLAQYPHHLVDIISPEASYSAARFRSDALALMAEATAQGKIPLLVGGTMLYYNALLKGLSDNLPQANPELRTALEERAAIEGWPALHAELAQLDPPTAARLKPNDAQRLQRALEIITLTGRPMSELLAEQKPPEPLPYRILSLALLPSQRSVLHERIALRFRQMLEGGLIEEVEFLRRNYQLDLGLPSMRCVGYRQVWEWMEGQYRDQNELCDRGIFATRQLAKRQITWLSNTLNAEAFDCLAVNLSQQVQARLAGFLDNTNSPTNPMTSLGGATT